MHKTQAHYRGMDNKHTRGQVGFGIGLGLVLLLIEHFLGLFGTWENKIVLSLAAGITLSWVGIALLARWGSRPRWLSWIVPIAEPHQMPSTGKVDDPLLRNLITRADELLSHPSASFDFAPHWNGAKSFLSDVRCACPELARTIEIASAALGTNAQHPTTVNEHLRPVRDALAARALRGNCPNHNQHDEEPLSAIATDALRQAALLRPLLDTGSGRAVQEAKVKILNWSKSIAKRLNKCDPHVCEAFGDADSILAVSAIPAGLGRDGLLGELDRRADFLKSVGGDHREYEDVVARMSRLEASL